MIKGNIPLIKEGKNLIAVIKQPEILKPGIDMMMKTFFNSCPVISGIPLHKEDLQTLLEESAKISMKEDLLLATIDPEQNKVLAMSISLSLDGKKKQEEVFNSAKWKEESTMNILFKLFEKIYVPYDSYPNPVYGFGLAVSADLVKNQLGTQLYTEGLKYWKNLGYKSRFTETTSRRSQSIVEKNGGQTIKSYEYANVEKDMGYKLKPHSIGERFSHQRTLF